MKLLVLYRKKLLRATAEYRELPDQPNTGRGNPPSVLQAQPHRKQFRPLRPAVTKLAQYASGLIESARIPQLDKIELQLRLAELESALEIATETIR